MELHGLDTEHEVFFYEQEFYVLSNFSAFSLMWQGHRFPTSEHAYHWEKFSPGQTDGKVDGFVCAVGTGGTLGGMAIALKERNKNIRIAAADPQGAAIYSWIKTGTLEMQGSSITEGIGQGRVTANLEGAPIDDAYQVPDAEALPIIFDLLQHEGLCMGGSTGINVAGAIRLAKQMGPGHTIVTVLCDYGTRYASKIFNPAFLRSKNLPVPRWLEEESTAPKVFEEVPA